jgi:hypothetical protein
MSRKKEYEFGTTDAERANQDHNEALAQRPDGSATDASATDDQAAIEALQRSSAQAEQNVTAGQTTTTTPDSLTGASGETASAGPGELDQMSAEDRLDKVRGWARGKRLGGPMSADWEELDQILQSDAAGEARRP